MLDRIWLMALVLACCVTCNAAAARVEHVIIIGIDGLSDEGVRKSVVPHMGYVMENGSWTLLAAQVLGLVPPKQWIGQAVGEAFVGGNLVKN